MGVPREKAFEQTLELSLACGEGGALLRNFTLITIYQDFEKLDMQNANEESVETAAEVSRAFLRNGLRYEEARVTDIYEDIQSIGNNPEPEIFGRAVELSKAFASGGRGYADARISEAYSRIRSLMETKSIGLQRPAGGKGDVADAQPEVAGKDTP